MCSKGKGRPIDTGGNAWQHSLSLRRDGEMYPDEVLALMLLWATVALVLITGIAAAVGKNRNGLGWIALALVLTPAGALILLAFLPRLPKQGGGFLRRLRVSGLPDEG